MVICLCGFFLVISSLVQLFYLGVLYALGGRRLQDNAAFATNQDLKDFNSGIYFYVNVLTSGSYNT